eukprot:scaffold1696_cov258-Pinguiococcus_pyrenoidosus.AAC.11
MRCPTRAHAARIICSVGSRGSMNCQLKSYLPLFGTVGVAELAAALSGRGRFLFTRGGVTRAAAPVETTSARAA